MTVFVALSVLLVAGALVFLLPPLLGRGGARKGAVPVMASNRTVYTEQLAELDAELRAGTMTREQWSAARGEIERRALDEAAEAPAPAAAVRSRALAAAIGVAVPVIAIALYTVLGNPQALSGGPGTAQTARTAQEQQIEAMLAEVKANLERDPSDTAGWIMLARGYSALGRYPDALSAYARALEQSGDDAQLLADYAQTEAMAQGRKFAGKPEALAVRALKIDGRNIKALAIAAAAAFEREDYRTAVVYWKRILPLVPDDHTQLGTAIRRSIADAETRIRSASSKQAAQPNVAGRDVEKGKSAPIQGRVSLAFAAAAKAQPEDAVFVFARAATGPRMPLAILRRQVKDLPFEFSLDDSMAMNPAFKLSDFDRVVVVARVSKSGLATPQKGDLEAVTEPLAPGTKNIRLELLRTIE